jgi:hypothetical protein
MNPLIIRSHEFKPMPESGMGLYCIACGCHVGALVHEPHATVTTTRDSRGQARPTVRDQIAALPIIMGATGSDDEHGDALHEPCVFLADVLGILNAAPDARTYCERQAEAVDRTCARCGAQRAVTGAIAEPWECATCRGWTG